MISLIQANRRFAWIRLFTVHITYGHMVLIPLLHAYFGTGHKNRPSAQSEEKKAQALPRRRVIQWRRLAGFLQSMFSQNTWKVSHLSSRGPDFQGRVLESEKWPLCCMSRMVVESQWHSGTAGKHNSSGYFWSGGITNREGRAVYWYWERIKPSAVFLGGKKHLEHVLVFVREDKPSTPAASQSNVICTADSLKHH